MKLLVSAMEPSSNLHLKEVAKHLKDCEYIGIFDESLGAPLYSPKEFSVMGIFDVLGKYFKAKEAIKALVDLAKEADKVLLIDAPAFNLPLAKAIKKAYPNKEVIYYILPKVWAWKKKRAKKVMQYTDKQLSIFPFEDSYYPHAIYVGNPLMDEIQIFKAELSVNDTIAYLPGSRRSEIRALMPILKKLQKKLSDKRSLLVIPSHLNRDDIELLYGDVSAFEVIRDTPKAVLEAEYAFVCSGTATLETALIGTPMALIYLANKWEYKLAKLVMKLPFVGLANLLFYFQKQPPMHSEFLQEDLTVENLLHAYETENRESYFQKSLELRAMLGTNCSQKVADIVMN